MCSGEEPEAPPPSQSMWPSIESELIRVLTCTVEELGLEWSAPEEPAPGLFDEWFLKGQHHPSSCQRPAPFMPVAHDELTKTWQAPYAARVNPSTAAAYAVCASSVSG